MNSKRSSFRKKYRAFINASSNNMINMIIHRQIIYKYCLNVWMLKISVELILLSSCGLIICGASCTFLDSDSSIANLIYSAFRLLIKMINHISSCCSFQNLKKKQYFLRLIKYATTKVVVIITTTPIINKIMITCVRWLMLAN